MQIGISNLLHCLFKSFSFVLASKFNWQGFDKTKFIPGEEEQGHEIAQEQLLIEQLPALRCSIFLQFLDLPIHKKLLLGDFK